MFDSYANYIMVQIPYVTQFIELLEKYNVFVRDRSNFSNLPQFVRISLGTLKDTDELIERLKLVFKELGIFSQN